MSSSPAAVAISNTAVRPARASRPVTGRPRASTVGTRRTWAPRLDATAAVKPSPPSDMGISTTSASGTTARTPRAMAAAASAAVIDSLKESGAMTILISVARQGLDRGC